MNLTVRIHAARETWRHSRRESLATRIDATRTAWRFGQTCEPRSWSF